MKEKEEMLNFLQPLFILYEDQLILFQLKIIFLQSTKNLKNISFILKLCKCY